MENSVLHVQLTFSSNSDNKQTNREAQAGFRQRAWRAWSCYDPWLWAVKGGPLTASYRPSSR
eukprot:7216173-Alexandrium_andersonii.AAC.1